MSEPVLILTMKWGTLYSAEDVNRLFRQVRNNLQRPHRFICMTDDKSGLAPEIEALPLPELGLPEGSRDTRWRKLALFNENLNQLSGTALFLDLDLVVVDDLSPFFEVEGDFIILRDDDLFRPKPLRKINPARDRFLHMVGNTSVFRFKVGEHPDIVDTYLADPVGASNKYEHEQQMVSDLLDKAGLINYWPKKWCASFKNDCVGRGLTSYLRDPICPSDAKIILFAGNPKMSDAFSGKGGKWYRKIGNLDWLRSAWLAEGGAR